MDWVSVVLSLVAAASYLAFAYGYNEFRDQHMEGLEEEALRERIGCGIVGLRGLFLGLVLTAFVAAAVIRWWVTLVVAVGLAGAILYSGGPRLKRLPVVGSITNLWIFVPLAFLGGDPTATPGFVHLLGAFSALLLQSQLIHEASHAQEDRREGVHTTALAFGPVVVRALSTLLGLLASLSLLWLALATGAWGAGVAAAILFLFTVGACLLMDFRGVSSWRKLRMAHRYVGLFGGALAWWSVA